MLEGHVCPLVDRSSVCVSPPPHSPLLSSHPSWMGATVVTSAPTSTTSAVVLPHAKAVSTLSLHSSSAGLWNFSNISSAYFCRSLGHRHHHATALSMAARPGLCCCRWPYFGVLKLLSTRRSGVCDRSTCRFVWFACRQIRSTMSQSSTDEGT